MDVTEATMEEKLQNANEAGADPQQVRNLLLEVVCLVIIGEMIAVLAGGNFSLPVTFVTLAEVFVLVVLSFLAKKFPLVTLVLALIVFITASVVVALLKPTFLGGSIIIKVFILIYMARAIPEARALQQWARS